jgi:hypothetical protein
MSVVSTRVKSVSLTFRGFNVAADEVSNLMGAAAAQHGNRGELVRPVVKTRLTRSYAIFSKEFPHDFDLSEMLPELLNYLGGEDHVFQVKCQVRPEFLEVHFDLPARQAESSQDGYLSESVVAAACRLGVSISFGFF